jgi:hypothetical protein
VKQNKIIVAGGIIVSGLLIFVIGDYFTLFGTRLESRYDFLEMNFKPVDEDTGSPVINVHVRCFQKNNLNACTERDSHKAGILSINIPITKQVIKSILFEQDMKIQDTLDPKLHIMFIHQDYANPVETYQISEITSFRNELIVVPMPRSIFSN